MTHRKQYEEWIDDAALGALDARRERELLAHAGECNVCRDAYQHARELATFVDRSVESLVAGEPSPHFAARLRARIAEEQPAPRFTWLTWKPVAAGSMAAAAAVAILWVFLAPSHTNLPPEPAQPGSTVASRTNPIETHTPGRPTAKAAEPDRLYATETRRHSGTTLLPQQRRHSIRPTHSRAEPEVLVPPGQLAAVMQLAADIRSGRIDGKKLVAEQVELRDEMQKPIDIPPIEVKPIEVPPVSSDVE